MLEIKGLKVVRDAFTVYLPELYIAKGQCVALCGASGSGKSTLMEAIGLLAPFFSIDKFIFDGIAVDELNPKEQEALRISQIGIMPQVGGLLPFLTVRENIELQISLALKQSVQAVFPNLPKDRYIPNTTVALQEAAEKAADNQKKLAKQVKEQNLRATKKMFRRHENGLVPVQLVNDKIEQNHHDAMANNLLNPYEIMAKDMEFAMDNIDTYSNESSSDDCFRRYDLIPETRRQYARSLKITNRSSKDSINQVFEDLTDYIKILNLSDKLDQLPEQLSIGERQRALFLRAIAHKPKLLLMDEPTSALDPHNASNLFNMIDEIASQSKTSCLIITHDLEAVSQYRQYVYDKECQTFLSSSKDELKDECLENMDNDIQLMSDMTIDYPAASGLSRSFNEYGSNSNSERNIVQKSKDQGFHEIINVVDHNNDQHIDKPFNHEQGHHMHYGYAHNTNHYMSSSLDYLNQDNDYDLLVTKHLGGYMRINDKISHYTTPIDRLQKLLKDKHAKQNSNNDKQGGKS